MADVYQLTDYQNQSMLRLANTDKQIMIVLEIHDDDEQSLKDRLSKEHQDAQDLIQLGLIEDKTNAVLEQIMAHKLKLGRGYRAYLITMMGFNMFNGPVHRVIQ